MKCNNKKARKAYFGGSSGQGIEDNQKLGGSDV